MRHGQRRSERLRKLTQQLEMLEMLEAEEQRFLAAVGVTFDLFIPRRETETIVPNPRYL